MEPTTDELKQRILKIKPDLPHNYSSFFIFFYPEYDNTPGKQKLRNVVNVLSHDKDITEKLERLVKTLTELKGNKTTYKNQQLSKKTHKRIKAGLKKFVGNKSDGNIHVRSFKK